MKLLMVMANDLILIISQKNSGIKDTYKVDGAVEVTGGQVVHNFQDFGEAFDVEFEILVKEKPEAPIPATKNNYYLTILALSSPANFKYLSVFLVTHQKGKIRFTMEYGPDDSEVVEISYEANQVVKAKISQTKIGLKHYRTLLVNDQVLIQKEFNSPKASSCAIWLRPPWTDLEFEKYGTVQNIRVTQYYPSGSTGKQKYI